MRHQTDAIRLPHSREECRTRQNLEPFLPRRVLIPYVRRAPSNPETVSPSSVRRGRSANGRSTACGNSSRRATTKLLRSCSTDTGRWCWAQPGVWLAMHREADDVFQAVFLSLTRLAKTIRHGQSIPNWLYMATCRIAARMRKRQRAVSIENAPEPSTAATAEADLVWREVRTALDEELQRLPERLRSPLLLCYLSGLTRDEAAEQLGWSLSTLKRRLDEGRTVLRRRLERRGISAAGLALAVCRPPLSTRKFSRRWPDRASTPFPGKNLRPACRHSSSPRPRPSRALP